MHAKPKNLPAAQIYRIAVSCFSQKRENVPTFAHSAAKQTNISSSGFADVVPSWEHCKTLL
eukprot:130614-Amphidinium_carterae.1